MKRYNLSFFIYKGYAKIINFTSHDEYVKESYIYSDKNTKYYINITFEDAKKACFKMQKRYFVANPEVYENLFNN